MRKRPPTQASFRTKAIPMTFARLIHLERLADDAHVRAMLRRQRADKKGAKR